MIEVLRPTRAYADLALGADGVPYAIWESPSGQACSLARWDTVDPVPLILFTGSAPGDLTIFPRICTGPSSAIPWGVAIQTDTAATVWAGPRRLSLSQWGLFGPEAVLLAPAPEGFRLVLVVAGLVAAVGSAYGVWQVTRLSPVEAMRHE